MGLAASQCRLLTLTSRCIDLELKCMQLSAAQIRNAEAGCALSEDYNNKLDILETRSKTEGDELCIYKHAKDTKKLTEDDVKLSASDIKNLGYNVVSSSFKNDMGTVAAPDVRIPSEIKQQLDYVKQAAFEPTSNYNYAMEQIELLENQNTELTAEKEAYTTAANSSKAEIQGFKNQLAEDITGYSSTISEQATAISTEETNISSANSDIARYGAEYSTQTSRMSQAQRDMSAMTTDKDGNRVPDEKARARAQEIYTDAQNKQREAYQNKLDAEGRKKTAEQNKSTAERLKREAEDNKRAAEAKSRAYQEMLDKTDLDVNAKCSEIDGKITNNNTLIGVYEGQRDTYKLQVESFNDQIAALEGELAISENIYSKGDDKMLSDAASSSASLVSNLVNGNLLIVDASGHECSYEDLVSQVVAKSSQDYEEGTTIDRTAYNEAKDKVNREYDNDQKKLSLEDKKIQMEMNQTQTQLNACNKEIDSVKSLIDKNIERGFDYSI